MHYVNCWSLNSTNIYVMGRILCNCNSIRNIKLAQFYDKKISIFFLKLIKKNMWYIEHKLKWYLRGASSFVSITF